MKFLKKDLNGIKFYWLLIAFSLSIIGICLGSAFDMDINNALYNKDSWFGNFFETYVLAFCYMIFPLGGMSLMIGLLKNTKKGWKIFGIVIYVISFLLNVYLSKVALSEKNEYGYSVSNALAYLIGVVVAMLGSAVAYLFLDKEKSSECIKGGSLILVCSGLILLTSGLGLKYLAARPRYRFLMGDALDQSGLGLTFKNWWEWSPFSHNSGDYFKSWPSGHTSAAFCFCLLPFLGSAFKKTNRYTNVILFGLAFVFTLLMALSRIVAGAHFLTDVSSAFALGVLLILLGYSLVDFVSRKKIKEAD